MKTKAELPRIEDESQAFDRRIEERVAAGFVPDLRRAVKCDYFYKSFWRDPHYINLYLGRVLEIFLGLLKKYCKPGASILDVGCGAGYFSLELARNGYHVQGIDISESCIQTARRTLDENPFRAGFGSLEYRVSEFSKAAGDYDIVLFSGSLHHMPDLYGATEHAATILQRGGNVLCYEPWHDRWQKRDAAQVALIRGLLAIVGHWYSQEEDHLLHDERGLEVLTNEVYDEFTFERDKNESDGQSPRDNVWSGGQILSALDDRFTALETRPGPSFIYRLLGGIRGNDSTIYRLADLLAAYDQFSVANGYLNPE